MEDRKPGDHPLTDILRHDLSVYGEEADDLIRQIGQLSSADEMESWWNEEIDRPARPEEVLKKARMRYAQLLARARRSSWETPE